MTSPSCREGECQQSQDYGSIPVYQMFSTSQKLRENDVGVMLTANHIPDG